MALEILTPKEMGGVDRLAIEQGPLSGIALMERAGAAVADVVFQRFPGAARVDVLCGPGNNGGDGYVAATILAASGFEVALWTDGNSRAGSDAEIAAQNCRLKRQPLEHYEPLPGGVVVDALYGAGLERPLQDVARAVAEKVSAAGLPVVAVDLPSGISGSSGEALGATFHATVTVTFVRKKPGHLLYSGRALCGDLVVRDIGISDAVVTEIGSQTFENLPALWSDDFPRPAENTYKYSRGHVAVFSGGPAATGAARLAAMAAARSGAGAVTLLSPPASLAVNAVHLTSIILRRVDGPDDVQTFFDQRKPSALVAGPGLGTNNDVAALLATAIQPTSAARRVVVLDADALTIMAQEPARWFGLFALDGAPATILTPHEGEFGRLFPEIHADMSLSKLEKARTAAKSSHSVIVYKGPDTVIADPDGRAAINSNGTPLLATAGSGDVLSGIITGLAGQGMAPFEAACAAVWLHAEAARAFGPGLIAEDLPSMLPHVLAGLLMQRAP
ncbi:MAG: NAD(P)H-hydrate dehydratase [Mesorhizobium sp.]